MANLAARSALVAVLTALLAPACSVGQGVGCVAGTLDVPGCWSGGFDLHPNFFAAIPTNSAALQIRVQNGIDYETFSDGLEILVDDLGQIRGDPLPGGVTRGSLLGQSLPVGLASGIAPPGIAVPVDNPPIVHATLYLDRTCRTTNVGLFALDAVTLEADGTCNHPAGVEVPLVCGPGSDTLDAGASAGASDAGSPIDAGAVEMCTAFQSPPPANGVAGSSIVFSSLFDGNIGESNAQQRRTIADFDLYLGDPREVCPGGPPPRCRGHLQGHVDFYFQRGRPAQPFP